MEGELGVILAVKINRGVVEGLRSRPDKAWYKGHFGAAHLFTVERLIVHSSEMKNVLAL